jgi:catechol-2,3-dioxygenase
MTTSQVPPRLERVLETVLYYSDEERTAAFYGGLLGLRSIGGEPGRSLFFRAGTGAFLLFRAERSLEGGRLPPHGARGPIHTCFLSAPGDYERWKAWLAGHGVPSLGEVRWQHGLSFYFSDPAGNLLEIASADIWRDG